MGQNLFGRQAILEVYTTAFVHRIVELKIDFEVNLDWNPEPNRAVFTVYNLSEVARDTIENEFIGLRFYAGYTNGFDPMDALLGAVQPQLFCGNIVVAQNEKISGGWATHLEAIDGGFGLDMRTREAYIRSAYFGKSYKAGTPVQLIIAEIAANLALPFELGFIARNDTLICGATYEGKTADVLNRLCKELNLQWSIQQGVLEISDKDAPVFSALTQYTMLSADTGLVGSPKITYNENPKKGDPDGSIECTSLLQSALRPKRPVMILPTFPASFAGINLAKQNRMHRYAAKAQGLFVVQRARHYGNNRDGVFHTDIECPVWNL